MSTVCPLLPLLSRAIVNAWNDRRYSDASSDINTIIKHFQEMEKLLLRDQEIHNRKITNPPIALPARIYTLLHMLLIECDCKPLNALHYSPRVSYEHIARSLIPKPKLFLAVINYWRNNQMKIMCRFITSFYTDRMRNYVDNLITSHPKICLLMLAREQNNAKTALESRYCLQGNLL